MAEPTVVRDERHGFGFRLGQQQTVERVAVVKGGVSSVAKCGKVSGLKESSANPLSSSRYGKIWHSRNCSAKVLPPFLSEEIAPGATFWRRRVFWFPGVRIGCGLGQGLLPFGHDQKTDASRRKEKS